MLTLHCNVLITRRREMCFVVDDAEVLQWSGRQVYGALEYVVNEGQTHCIVEGEDPKQRLHLTIRRA